MEIINPPAQSTRSPVRPDRQAQGLMACGLWWRLPDNTADARGWNKDGRIGTAPRVRLCDVCREAPCLPRPSACFAYIFFCICVESCFLCRVPHCRRPGPSACIGGHRRASGMMAQTQKEHTRTDPHIIQLSSVRAGLVGCETRLNPRSCIRLLHQRAQTRLGSACMAIQYRSCGQLRCDPRI